MTTKAETKAITYGLAFIVLALIGMAAGVVLLVAAVMVAWAMLNARPAVTPWMFAAGSAVTGWVATTVAEWAYKRFDKARAAFKEEAKS